MGYTHYFTGLVANEELADATRGIVSAAEERGIGVFGPAGYGAPVISPELIALNGDAELGLDYESFVIGDVTGFNFCKTARRPYDAVVTAILIWAILHKSEGYENIGTDGQFDDWANPHRHDGTDREGVSGFELCEVAMGRKLREQEVAFVKEIADL